MTHPCPSCGYCPTCGRRGPSLAPYWPRPYWPVQPWYGPGWLSPQTGTVAPQPTRWVNNATSMTV